MSRNIKISSSLYIILLLISFVPAFTNQSENSPVILHIDFDNFNVGAFTAIEKDNFSLISKNGADRILGKGGRISSQCLYLTGGEDHVVELSINNLNRSIGFVSFKGQRLSSELPFHLTVESFVDNQWIQVYQDDSIFQIDQFSRNIYIAIPQKTDNKIRFRCTSPDNGGFLLDDLIVIDNSPMKMKGINCYPLNLPILVNKEFNPAHKLSIICHGEYEAKMVTEIELASKGSDGIDILEAIQIYYTGSKEDFDSERLFGETKNLGESMTIKGKQSLNHGTNYFWVSYKLTDPTDIRSNIYSHVKNVKISDNTYQLDTPSSYPMHRTGIGLRDHNDNGVHTYRIPGLVTTNEGTLVAVYDIRKNSTTDLQGDIDVGMSRSTDAGNTWEPMKVIMDMGKWGGLAEDENGIGDPSILVDRATNTIWVAGVWAHGHKNRRNWTESKPGLNPRETSQLMLVKSEDDGITWSKPINITEQVKQEGWHLLLQGPGKGITLSNGTLVFPAQFKNEEQIPYSTIIWSKDHGLTWNIGSGAKSNTTESQVIELNDGRLMLNMRDNRNRDDKSDTNGRSVVISEDLGITWKEHPTSRSALIEPVCMGSLIKDQFTINGELKSIVLFSNPASKYQRKNLSIKLSFDDGNSWPSAYYTLFDEGVGRGYSCMTKIDDQHIGILYESSRADLVFQVINIEKIINKAKK